MPAEGPRSPFAASPHPTAGHPLTHGQRLLTPTTSEGQLDVVSPDLIRSGYQALRRGDEQPLGSLLEADVEWRQARRGGLRRRAVCRGRDDVLHAFRAMIAKGALGDPHRWLLHDVLVLGELAAVTFSWTTPASTTVHLAHVLRLATGRIIAIQDHVVTRTR